VNGIDYLLDTNFILGLLKAAPETLALIDQRQIEARQCAYSAITRMELLGFPALTASEETLIQRKLGQLIHAPITPAVEDAVIRLRRIHTIKLPDAIIAASALTLGAELLTHDQKLQAVMAHEIQRRACTR
jgi:predicted nucleic acid-binding protein